MRRLMITLLVVLVCAPGVARAQAPPRPGPAMVAIVSPPMPKVGPDERMALPAGKPPLAEVLENARENFIDVTGAVTAGRLSFGGANVLVIGSGALAADDGRIAKVLADGRDLLNGFVHAGGVLVVLTGLEDAGKLTFLPDGMSVGIESLGHNRRVTSQPDHPLIAGKHRLTERDLGDRKGVLYGGGCYGRYRGLKPLVAYDTRGRYPIVLEGVSGGGRVVLIHLRPDRASLTGTDDEKVSATLVMENLLGYLRSVLAGRAPAARPVERVLAGVVFEDTNGDGRKDPGEKPLTGVELTDGGVLVRAGADGRYALRPDAYSEFIRVVRADDLRKYKRPLWRRIPGLASRLDVGLVPREKPAVDTGRVIYMADLGGGVKREGDSDPALSFMLEEISRLEPKPDSVICVGDASACELRAEVFGRSAPGLEVLHEFRPAPGTRDVIAAADEFRKAFGPTPATSAPHAGEPPELASDVGSMLELLGEIPSFRAEGLASPPSFRIIDTGAGGGMRGELRIAGVRELLHSIHPGPEATVVPGRLDLTLAVGDTSVGSDIPVKIEMAAIRRVGERLELTELQLPPCRLVSRGRFTKSVEFAEPVELTDGFYVMKLTAVTPAGGTWHRNVSFAVRAGDVPESTFESPWPVPGGGERHTGEVKDTLEVPFRLAGVTHLGERVLSSSPVIVDGAVLIRPEEGDPFRPVEVGESGVEPPRQVGVRLMRFPFLHHEQGRFELRPGHVLLKSAEVPPRTFRFDFGERLPEPQRGHMVVGGEFLCVVDEAGSATGFLRSRGAEMKDDDYDRKAAAESLRWQVKISPGCRQAVATEVELFTGNECLDIGTGRLRWKLDKYVLRDHSIAFSGRRLVVTGVTTADGPAKQVVLVVEPDSGKIRWEKVLAEVRPLDDVRTPAPAVAYDTVFVGSADGVFRALGLSRGEELWSYRTGNSVIPLSADPSRRSGRISSAAVVSERYVFFGAADGRIYVLERRPARLERPSDGRVYALEHREGTLKWSYDVGLPIAASPAVSGNTLVVADWDGNLYTFVSLVERKERTPLK